MAIRSITPLEDLQEMLATARATYKKSLETDISQYSMQDRQVIYEVRRNIRQEMQVLERKVGLADPDINALGVNKVDFRNFRRGNSQ
jgi:hypothetical protein